MASRWTRVVLAAAAVVGLGDSAYLTAVHYTASPLACVQNGVVNCDLVTRSSYGLVPGTALPVSAAGLLWFAVSLALALLPTAFGRERGLAAAQVAWALGGSAVALYLVYAELRLGHLCEWCTLVHVLVVVSLLAAMARLVEAAPATE